MNSWRTDMSQGEKTLHSAHEDLAEEDLVFDTLDSLGLGPSCMVPMVCNTDVSRVDTVSMRAHSWITPYIIDNLPCEVLEELIVQKGLFANPFEDNDNGTLASSLEGMGGLDSSSRVPDASSSGEDVTSLAGIVAQMLTFVGGQPRGLVPPGQSVRLAHGRSCSLPLLCSLVLLLCSITCSQRGNKRFGSLSWAGVMSCSCSSSSLARESSPRASFVS